MELTEAYKVIEKYLTDTNKKNGCYSFRRGFI